MKKLSVSLIALAFAAGSAQAQDTGAQAADQGAVPPAADAAAPGAPAADAPPAAPDAASPAADAGATAVTDAEVQSYAEATVKVQEIAKNTALDDQAKQQQMSAAVTEAGLAPERFNEITQAIGTDAELRTRIQTAMAAHAAAHQG